MIKRNFKTAATVLCATSLLMMGSGCAHKTTKNDGESASPAIETTDMGSSDMGNALGLESVHFNYDSNQLASAAKKTLKKDAAILIQNPTVNVQIEGHCDARGGIQYNIALGEKRAAAVSDYLSDQGVAKSRLTTISYGKERPIDSGTTDAAYAKNRRANLVITKK